MALLQINLLSRSLMRTVPVTVVLPVDKMTDFNAPLLPHNRDFAAYLEAHNLPVTFEEGPGGHEWPFWDAYIQKALDWLPIPQVGPGINSGHVGV